MNIDVDKLRPRLTAGENRHILSKCGFQLDGEYGTELKGILGPQDLGEGQNGNFSVDLERGLVKDFGSSGYEGDIFHVVMDTQNLTFPECLKWIVDELHLDPKELRLNGQSTGSHTRTKRPPTESRKSGPKSVPTHKQVAGWHTQLMSEKEEAKAARLYLTDTRGISREILKTAKIGLEERRFDSRGQWWITIPVPPLEKGSLAIVAVKKYAFDPSQVDWKRDEKGNKIVHAIGSASLYPLIPSEPHGPILICEGEIDALSALSNGFAAVTGTAGASSFKPEWASYLASLTATTDAPVIVTFDGDDVGRRQAVKAARKLFKAGLEVRVANPPDGADVNDVLVEGGREALNGILETASTYVPHPEPANVDAAVGTLASDVRTEQVDWLWKPWLPVGELTILDGDPGLGKSTLTCELAARLTTGRPMANQPVQTPPCGVVMVGAEDSLAHTVRPRLEAAGADLKRINLIQTLPGGDGAERPVVIPDDLDRLASAIQRVDARLLVIDPLMAHLSESINSHRDQDIRRALTPISKFAEACGVAVLVIRHLNKTVGVQALYRGGGSIGIIGQARIGWLIGKDPSDHGRRIIAPTKNNLTLTPKSLAFRLVQADSLDVARIQWEGTVSLSPDDLLESSPKQGRPPEQRNQVKRWLSEQLADGPQEASYITEKAVEKGFSKSTLKRAKKDLNISSDKDGNDGSWWWSLEESQ
jgi:hypothetical protein